MNTMENTAHMLRDCIQFASTADQLNTISKFTRLFIFDKYRHDNEQEAQKLADCLIAEVNAKHLAITKIANQTAAQC